MRREKKAHAGQPPAGEQRGKREPTYSSLSPTETASAPRARSQKESIACLRPLPSAQGSFAVSTPYFVKILSDACCCYLIQFQKHSCLKCSRPETS